MDLSGRSTEVAFVGHHGGNSAVVFDMVDFGSRCQIDDESDILDFLSELSCVCLGLNNGR